MKKIADGVTCPHLRGIVNYINENKIVKDDIIGIYKLSNTEYALIFYKSISNE